MKTSKTIRRVMAMAMIAALVMAPVMRPAMAETDAGMPPSATEADHGAMAMSGAMAGDMPCCPSNSHQPVDCEKCLLMAACMVQCFTGHPDAELHLVRGTVGTRLPLHDDFWPDGLGHPPPDHPPRILI